MAFIVPEDFSLTLHGSTTIRVLENGEIDCEIIEREARGGPFNDWHDAARQLQETRFRLASIRRDVGSTGVQ